ncbi:DNA repair protein RecO [Sphingobacterium sp. DK4209]|uniref:DNA repair protein RecO n=1 Tax=Sphingobacterium zhuxiongii TaxID=2662364 RepID=A0A5Q0QB00_9SPHI|nr:MULTISPECIES: DNA repair protein RecO [unclassified Sphingobacterium]MVZ65818.1 DNA repair protein RecO [Sphingobacterium sp. DK4209]QGA24838.1 DNA repair protein RecO [Sphingobacterium sp. dk4302]
MLHQTKGITLKITNYSESSVVAQIYTEAFGLQSYLINGARKPKAKISTNMLQPFHLLELVVYNKENNNLQRIKEAQHSPVLKHVPLDIVKSSIALFLNEILYKVLRHQATDKHLFEFLENAIMWLDESEVGLANYHLIFLLKLTHYLGFKPSFNDQPYFDLIEGRFVSILPPHVYTLQEPYTSILRELANSSFSNCNKTRLKREDRSYLLQKLVDYYRLHTENFGELNSLYVLEEIFD